MNYETHKAIKFNLTTREKQLIIFIRKLKFGKLEVDVRDGTPQNRIKQKEKLINLDDILVEPLDKHF